MTPDETHAMLASSGAEMRMVLEAQEQTPEIKAFLSRAQSLFADLEAHFQPNYGIEAHFWQAVATGLE